MTEALQALADLFSGTIVAIIGAVAGGWFVLLIVRAIKAAIK